MRKSRKNPPRTRRKLSNSDGKLIKSFVSVGDVIEIERDGEKNIFKVEKFEVVMNSPYTPTEFVIVVKFRNLISEGRIECTSDRFNYVRHISHAN